MSLMPGQTPPESCQPPPEPPSHSPRIARARHQTAFVLLQRTGQGGGLAGGAHADGNEGGQKIGGDGEARTFWNVVDVADDFQAAARADDSREQFGEAVPGTFDAGRDNAGGNDGGFEQTEVVFGEIEYFGQVRDIYRGTQIDAGQDGGPVLR